MFPHPPDSMGPRVLLATRISQHTMWLRWTLLTSCWLTLGGTCFYLYPIGSMYGIFPYIWLIFMVNVSKYAIHGSYGYCRSVIFVLQFAVLHSDVWWWSISLAAVILMFDMSKLQRPQPRSPQNSGLGNPPQNSLHSGLGFIKNCPDWYPPHLKRCWAPQKGTPDHFLWGLWGVLGCPRRLVNGLQPQYTRFLSRL